MSRHLLPAGLALLLGVVANIGIAWWCAVALDAYETTPTITQKLNPGEWIRIMSWESIGASRVVARRIRDDALLGLPSDEKVLPGWQLGLLKGAAPHVTHCADARGWPMLSMYSDWPMTSARSPRSIRGGLESTIGRPDPLGRQTVIPLNPLWAGFAVNTLAYGVLFWMGMALAPRLRKGRADDPQPAPAARDAFPS